MSNPFDYFQKIYCCTIPQNVERITFMTNQAIKFNFAIQFVIGTYSPGSQTAVTENHLAAYRDALKNGYSRVLVLEDDCEFLPEIENLELVLKEWEVLASALVGRGILYLGGWVMGANYKATPHLNQVSKITCLHSYVPTPWLMEKLLKEPYTNYYASRPLDLVISEEIVPLGCAYVARPLMTRQRPSWSNVRGKFDDKSNMQKWSMEALKNE